MREDGKTELLAPAGDFKTALAAFEAGADAVYCGLGDFSARAFAQNFSAEELKLLVRYAHKGGKKVYVTFNTLIDECDLETAIERVSHIEASGADAVIVQDLGIAKIVREHFPKLALHASTQLVAHNLEGVLALRELGFSRVVLARELSLAEIAQIAKRCGETELEVFIHGALCYSVSGLCLYGAMEKGRSGNRGKCPYCCRQSATIEGETRYPFSMKDLRLGEDALKLVEAGVVSLKIEGRMKTPLYVASVTKWYRGILDRAKPTVTCADLETVFSRRTTELRFSGGEVSPIDSESLGHKGTPIGTVKRITKDREGVSWLRFHTLRAIERHDGLQFDALTEEGRHFGFGITGMRQAISRVNVFEVAAGTDVEVELPPMEKYAIRSGDTVYLSMSNAVKRMFPAPAYRESDYPGDIAIDVEIAIGAEKISARQGEIEVSVEGKFDQAKNPEKTFASVEKAFAKLGGSDYRLGKLTVDDPERRFAPMSVLNDLRRDLIDKLDAMRERTRQRKVDDAVDALAELDESEPGDLIGASVRIREGEKVPAGEWDEVVVVVGDGKVDAAISSVDKSRMRWALPVWNGELEFNRLRNRVKALLREGYSKWECSDLATLRMLKTLGVTDISSDWTLYAFNSAALSLLASAGVKRFTASPENGAENLAFLNESGYAVAGIAQQTTPLFISLHEPAAMEADGGAVVSYPIGGLWVTAKKAPRCFELPSGMSRRIDLSWDRPC